MKIKMEQIKTADELKNIFLSNKDNLKWFNWVHRTPYREAIYGRTKNSFYCKQTDTEFMINGVGTSKICIDSYYYTWENLFKKLHTNYTKNSNLINSFFLVFFEDYYYEKYDETTIYDIIKNRENCQYVLKKEVPAYILMGDFRKVCNTLELPIIRRW